MIILTIDTGTTNTRVCVWRNGEMIATQSAAAGVRDTAISGSVVLLETAVRDAISITLAKADVSAAQVDLAIASGMITSNLGLHEVPHASAPAGLEEIAAGMSVTHLPQVFSKPIWFVPGVRNSVLSNAMKIGLDDCEAMDMMRGEEVEVMGLIARLRTTGPAMFVMPGSHTKFVSVDAQGRITGCATTLAGELLQTITNNTILAKTLQNEFAATLDVERLLAGAALADRVGLGRVCFSTRILEMFGDCDRNGRANFLLGAVLASDLLTLRHSSALSMRADTPLVIAGSGVLQAAMATLIAKDAFFTGPVTVASASQQAHLAGFGAMGIATARGLIASDTPIDNTTFHSTQH